MKNEKMLIEMMSENFIEIAKEEQEVINGGISKLVKDKISAMYSASPIKVIGKRALYSVSPTRPGHVLYPEYSVSPIKYEY